MAGLGFALGEEVKNDEVMRAQALGVCPDIPHPFTVEEQDLHFGLCCTKKQSGHLETLPPCGHCV